MKAKQKKVMTPDEFAARMSNILASDDIECRHASADVLMCELLTLLGYKRGADKFLSADAYYS